MAWCGAVWGEAGGTWMRRSPRSSTKQSLLLSDEAEVLSSVIRTARLPLTRRSCGSASDAGGTCSPHKTIPLSEKYPPPLFPTPSGSLTLYGAIASIGIVSMAQAFQLPLDKEG